MNKLTGDIHFNDKQFFFFCEFCEKDRALTDEDECEKCGRNFVHGMEEEELLIILKNYRELIKMLASFFDSYSDDIPVDIVRYYLKTINDYVDENGFVKSSVEEALQEIANRLKDDE